MGWRAGPSRPLSFSVGVAWVFSSSVGGSSLPGGVRFNCVAFEILGGVPASPPSYTLQKVCKLIEVMTVIVIIYCKVEYW